MGARTDECGSATAPPREIAGQVAAVPEERWVEHARILAAASGRGPDRVLAARWLTSLGRLDEADLLIDRTAGGRDWDHAVARAELDIALGRCDHAVQSIDGAEHLASTEERVRDLVRLWTGALGGRIADHDGLKQRVERVLPRLSDPVERT